MEDKILTKNAYSLMFLVLAVWSFLPYLLPSGLSLTVFSKYDLGLGILYVVISLIACYGTFFNQKYAYSSGIISILIAIFYLASEQLRNPYGNPLQLATMLTMIVILGVFSSIFKASIKPKRQRLSTLSLQLESNF